MTDLEASFGKRVRELRTKIGMTQSQLAEATDMSVEWVRRIEQGKASPSFDTIAALAKALGVKPQEFFAEAPTPMANRILSAMQGLTEAQIEWLLAGARLMKSPAPGKADPPPPRRPRLRIRTRP